MCVCVCGVCVCVCLCVCVENVIIRAMSIRLCVVCFYPNIAFGRVRVSAARKHWTGTMYITVLFFCSEALMLLELRRRCMLFLGK